MDGLRFDALVKALGRVESQRDSRRSALRATMVTLLALIVPTSAITATPKAAKHRHRFVTKAEKKRKRKKRPPPAPPQVPSVPPCIPDNSNPCDGKQCGTVVNSCGQSISCGACVAPATCQNGRCAPCVPDCTGKRCGPNNCGGSCGTCIAPETCLDGICGCVPNCTDKTCGPDGCGDSCGTCTTRGDVCREDGQCVGAACGIGAKICSVGSDVPCCVASYNCCPAGNGIDGCCETDQTCCPSDQQGCCFGLGATCCPDGHGCCQSDRPICCPGGGCCSADTPVCCPNFRCCPENRPVCCPSGCCAVGEQCGPSFSTPCLAAGTPVLTDARAQGVAATPRLPRLPSRSNSQPSASRHARRHGQ